MKTSLAKKEDVNTKWYLIDATDKVMGRMSTIIANKLRGKDKPCFSPHMDCGDHVVVINTDKIRMTGNKEQTKMYQSHSGYPGGFREETAEVLKGKKPTKLLELAVKGMLPRNKLRDNFMKKLKLYPGEEHEHQAQNPEKLEV